MATLVTGGAGFIGSHLCESLLEKGEKVVCLDNFNDYYSPARKKKNIAPFLENKNFTLAKGDILDAKLVSRLFSRHPFRSVYHLAARAGVRASLQDPGLYAQVNVQGTVHLLEAARKHDVGHFVFASSSSVYGLTDRFPFSEEDPAVSPVSPYGASKRAAELECFSFSHLYGLPVACARLFTVYGPRGRPDMAPYKFLDLLHKGKTIPVYGDGSAKRSFTYVSDIVEGLLACGKLKRKFETINLGNDETVTVKHFISLLEQASGKKARLAFQPKQPGDMEVTQAGIAKAKRLLGWKPKTRLKEGLEKMAEWFRNGNFAVR